jgi:hypothetical protein
MADAKVPESAHERRVTWSLMAAVVAFVLLMSCIVLWVTASLIRNEKGAALPPAVSATAPPAPPTSQPTAPPIITSTPRVEATSRPILVNATWTPYPGPKRHVRFSYWYVRPNKITVGECVQVTWETEFASKLEFYRNDELIVENAPVATTLEDCPTQTGYVVYRLVAWNNVGESNWIQLQVKVSEAP